MNIISSKNIIREFCLIVFISTKQQKKEKKENKRSGRGVKWRKTLNPKLRQWPTLQRGVDNESQR